MQLLRLSINPRRDSALLSHVVTAGVGRFASHWHF
jgi:hypothetical protein